MTIIHKPFQDLNRPQVERLLRLQDKVWPKAKEIARPTEERIDEYLTDPDKDYEVFLLEDGDTLLAHAEIFPRTILTSSGEMEVMALASVCSPPDRRGEGFGKSIVQEAFKLVDQGRFRVSLFQTRVPDFYLRLGAKEISNDFINSKGKEGTDSKPWWNPHQMIYPVSFPDWPEGEIDLLGHAY